MDVQNGVVDRLDGPKREGADHLCRHCGSREDGGVPVVYVRVAFRDGTPEVSPNNKTFSAVRERGTAKEGDAATQIHRALAPQNGDIIVTRRRVSAFSGSDLGSCCDRLGWTRWF